MIVIAVGNPFDGIKLVGLFDDPEEAVTWAERELRNEDWHVVPIETR